MHPTANHPPEELPLSQPQQATLHVSLELSRSTWLVTSLAPGSKKMSKHTTPGGDGAALLALLARLRAKAEQPAGVSVRIAVIQEAGLDGFWVHRLLTANDIASHVVDPASIAMPRRRRRAKTDAIDGETLLRTCWRGSAGSHVSAPWLCPRRLNRKTAAASRGNAQLCFRSGSSTSIASRACSLARGSPTTIRLHKDRRLRLDALKTGDGRPLPVRLKAEVLREIERIELLLRQIAVVETERDAAVEPTAEGKQSPVTLLARFKAIGPQIAAVLYYEGLYRNFANRREVAAYSGLVPTPWRSGTVDREQGISKAGNRRLRHIMIELAWLWVRHQPDSALSRWFRARVGDERGRVRRIAIVALARRLLIALWRYVSHGEVPEGAVLKAA
jgi:transposase